ncbi:MAG: transcriptional regulator TetR family, partial [Firmicutes bacterium]|nr:transcriptional regulator TetR family [Bacillota bacterium]
DRKESVILSAVEIIDELGIQGLSTREIAKRQGISEGTLFRHFRSKNDIIAAVLDFYSKYDEDIFHSVRLKHLKAKAAIVFVTDAYATYYENYPAITAITQLYSVLLHQQDFAAKVNSILHGRRNCFRQIIENGQKEGEIRPEADSSILADIIGGTFDMVCLMWRLGGYSFSLRGRMLLAVNTLLESFSLQNTKEEKA